MVGVPGPKDEGSLYVRMLYISGHPMQQSELIKVVINIPILSRMK